MEESRLYSSDGFGYCFRATDLYGRRFTLMLRATFRPLEQWHGQKTPDAEIKRSRFRASYQQTLALLEDELNTIGAESIVVEAEYQHNQIRNDGWPLSKSIPSGPAVILHFRKGNLDVSMPCDRFETFEDNLRAIALSLEALRTVDRYGVTKGSEQYQGFKRLGEPSRESREEWAIRFIREHSGVNLPDSRKGVSGLKDVDGDALKFAYRSAAKKLHPDVSGSAQLFHQLQEAMKILERR